MLCLADGTINETGELAMPERKVKIPFPTPTSPLKEGIEVGVKESTERWTDVTLEDGSVLRLKASVIGAVRIVDEFDPEGNPMYALKAGQVLVIASAPDRLRKPQVGKVH